MVRLLFFGVLFASTSGRVLADSRTPIIRSSRYLGRSKNVSSSSSGARLSDDTSIGVIEVDVNAPKPDCWTTSMETALSANERLEHRRQASPDTHVPEELPPDFGETMQNGLAAALNAETLRFLEGLLDQPRIYWEENRFTSWEIKWPRRSTRSSNAVPEDQRTEYRSTILTYEGFLAVQNDRQGGMPEDWSLSKLAWFMWRGTLQCEYGAEWIKHAEKLQWLYYQVVVDEDSRRVIGWAIRRKTNPVGQVNPRGEAVWQRPRPGQEGEDAEAFWAILGGPFGVEVWKLLTDNKKVLRDRTIHQVGVFYDVRDAGDPIYDVWVEVGHVSYLRQAEDAGG